MLGSEAILSLKNRLSRMTSPGPEFESWVLTELRLAQGRLEGSATLPWFLITEQAFEEVVADEERVSIPEDFIREVETDNMQIEDTESNTFTDLKKKHYDVIRRRYGDAPGRPEAMALSGGYFRLRPIPDKNTYTLWMTYFARDAQIELEEENLWLRYMPDLVMSEAGIVLATALRNDQAVGLYGAINQEEKKRLNVENVAREMENFDPNPED